MYEKYVKNFFIVFLHNFPCVYTTYLEGPTIPNNLNSDTISSNCAADYFEIFIFNYSLCSVRKFVDINSYILCWNICVIIYSTHVKKNWNLTLLSMILAGNERPVGNRVKNWLVLFRYIFQPKFFSILFVFIKVFLTKNKTILMSFNTIE